MTIRSSSLGGSSVPLGSFVPLSANGPILAEFVDGTTYLRSGQILPVAGYPTMELAPTGKAYLVEDTGEVLAGTLGVERVASDGADTYVIIQTAPNVLVSTDKGVTWTLIDALNTATTRKVYFFDGKFYVVGNTVTAILVSESVDGVTWTAHANVVAVGLTANTARMAYSSIAGGIYALITQGGATNQCVRTSADATSGSWVALSVAAGFAAAPEAVGGGAGILIGLTGTTTGLVVTSLVAQTPVTLPSNIAPTVGGGVPWFDGTYYVYCTTAGLFNRSVDGATWLPVVTVTLDQGVSFNQAQAIIFDGYAWLGSNRSIMQLSLDYDLVNEWAFDSDRPIRIFAIGVDSIVFANDSTGAAIFRIDSALGTQNAIGTAARALIGLSTTNTTIAYMRIK